MLDRFILDAGAASAFAAAGTIAAEFPGVTVVVGGDDGSGSQLTISMEDWQAYRIDVYAMDSRLRRLADEGPLTLRLVGAEDGCAAIALEVLGRCQRFIGRRNPASADERFDRLLGLHRALHDLSKPLVSADWEHALDAWRWTLRLDAQASLAVQVAALFHDVERLTSEAEARVEHLAPDYQAFKDEHARRGAALARATILSAGLDAAVAARAAALIEDHERPRGGEEAMLLNEADALSFFSLNSHGFLDYYGPAHTRRKIDYSLRRLRPEARARLRSIRLRPEVLALLREVEAS